MSRSGRRLDLEHDAWTWTWKDCVLLEIFVFWRIGVGMHCMLGGSIV
jgi:hypothetical protein